MEIRVRDIPPEQHKALKMLAVEREITLQEVMLQMIREYIERERGKQ